MLRLLNLVVLAVLMSATVYVYRIKYEATGQIEQIARLKADIASEQSAIADLKARWSDETRPERIQALAEKYLTLKPMAIPQIGKLDGLPEKPHTDVDPIGSMVEALGLTPDDDAIKTGSMPLPSRRPEVIAPIVTPKPAASAAPARPAAAPLQLMPPTRPREAR